MSNAEPDQPVEGAAFVSPLKPTIPADQIEPVKKALTRYRVMAYIVGTMLVVLICIAMPLKYIWHDGRLVTIVGIAHGWLYMGLLITAWDLGRRVFWSLRNLILIALAGTIPFLSFVAEYIARKDVQNKIAYSNPNILR